MNATENQRSRSKGRTKSPRRERTGSRRRRPGSRRRTSPGRRQTRGAGDLGTTTTFRTTHLLPTNKEHKSGFHPSLVAGLTLLFIVIIIVLIVVVKICLRRRTRLKKGSVKEKNRISSYKMYSEVDQSVMIADRFSVANNLRGPEDDSIEEYLKRSAGDSYEGIELQEMETGNGNDIHKYDYITPSVTDENKIYNPNGDSGRVVHEDGYFVLEPTSNHTNNQNLSNASLNQ